MRFHPLWANEARRSRAGTLAAGRGGVCRRKAPRPHSTPSMGHCLDLFRLQKAAIQLPILWDIFGSQPHLPHFHFIATAFTDMSSYDAFVSTWILFGCKLLEVRGCVPLVFSWEDSLKASSASPPPAHIPSRMTRCIVAVCPWFVSPRLASP